MNYLSIEKMLDDNGINNAEMDHIIEVVSESNWKLKSILDTGMHWSELNKFVLQSAIDIYNRDKDAERRQ